MEGPEVGILSATEIAARLPHRFPFLLVDRVLELEPGRRVVALKNVTVNEPFFPGHFPGEPVMPGVLICEALFQAGGLVSTGRGERSVALASIESARFRRKVVPGDQLRLEVAQLAERRSFLKMEGVATVGGEIAVEARFTILDRPREAAGE